MCFWINEWWDLWMRWGWGRGRMLLARDSDSVLCVQNELSEEKYYFFRKRVLKRWATLL